MGLRFFGAISLNLGLLLSVPAAPATAHPLSARSPSLLSVPKPHISARSPSLLSVPKPHISNTTPYSGEVQFIHVACPDISACWAIGNYDSDGYSEPVLASSSDAGAHWFFSGIPDAGALAYIFPHYQLAFEAIDCPSATTCVLLGQAVDANEYSSFVLVTQDAGSSWSIPALPSGGMGMVLTNLSCPSSSACLASGSTPSISTFATNSIIVGSTALSVSWSYRLAPAKTDNIYAISCPTPNLCLATATNSQSSSADLLLESSDGGNSWTETAHNLGELITCPTLQVCFSYTPNAGPTIYATTDGGTTWTNQTYPGATPPPGSYGQGIGGPTQIDCSSPTTCLAVGSLPASNIAFSPSGFAIVTTDGGSTWRQVPLPSWTTTLASVSCGSASSCVAVGFGTVLTSETSGNSWIWESAPCGAFTAGYSIIGADGSAYSFGEPYCGSEFEATSAPIVAAAAIPLTSTGMTAQQGGGYLMLASDGSVYADSGPSLSGTMVKGSPVGTLLSPAVGIAIGPSDGYWITTSNGTVYTYGPSFYGSPCDIFGSCSLSLNQPIVGMASTPDGKGYWLVASDGGIFSYGDAQFYGSTGNIQLNQPIVGMASTPDGKGYWLVASDGGIFSYGDAQFYGSTGGTLLNSSIVAIAAPSN